MNQLYLPMDFSDRTPENHAAQVISDVVDGLSDNFFIRAMTQILHENLPIIWLAAGQPNYWEIPKS